jgi:hypothetical protein
MKELAEDLRDRDISRRAVDACRRHFCVQAASPASLACI